MKTTTQFYCLFALSQANYVSGFVPFDHDFGKFLEELRDVELAPERAWIIKSIFRKGTYSYK